MTTLETPLEIVNTHTVNKYSVEIRNFVLHKEVTLVIHLSNDSNFVHSIQYKIEGDEYTQWGDDDSYIETIVQREIEKLRRSTVLEEIPLEEFDIVEEPTGIPEEPVKKVRKPRTKKTV